MKVAAIFARLYCTNTIFLIAVFFSRGSNIQAQVQHIIVGYITTKHDERPVFEAQVAVDTRVVDVSNELGFFKFEVSEGQHTLLFSHAGYENVQILIGIDRDTQLTIYMEGHELPEIKVTATPFALIDRQGKETISQQSLKKIPLVLGVLDPIKALASLPGINMGLEGSANIVVRGGEADQNLLLLDNLELYHKNHLFGFNSSLNGDMLEYITVYKNYFPPKYGGRLSSVLFGRSKTAGDSSQTKVSIGLLNSSLYRNTPLKNGKSALQIAARTSYQGFLLAPFISAADPTEKLSTKLYFFDAVAKYELDLDMDTHLEILGQMGSDRYQLIRIRKNAFDGSLADREATQSNIASRGISLDFRKRFTKKVFLNAGAYNNLSRNVFSIDNRSSVGGSISSTMAFDRTTLEIWGHKSSIQLKQKLVSLEVGVQNEWYKIRPQMIDVNNVDIERNQILKKNTDPIWGSTHNLFGEMQLKYSNFTVYGGPRISLYSQGSFRHFTIEPRVGIEWGDLTRFSIWYNQNTQYLHSVNSLNALVPIDFLLPSTEEIAPQSAMQFSGEVLMHPFSEMKSTFTISPFYKKYTSLSQIRPGIPILFNLNEQWDRFLVTSGRGTAYGVEISVQKNSGFLQGNLSYIFTRSKRLFPEVNQGKVFVANFDRPHEVKINLGSAIGDHWQFNISANVASGLSITLPSTLVPDFFGFFVAAYDGKNNYRLPVYHKVDAQMSYTWTSKRAKEKSISLGLYNLYGRKNYINIFYDVEKVRGNKIRGKFDALYLFTFVPSLNYTVSW